MSETSENYQKMLERVELIVKEVASQNVDLDLMIERVEEGYELIHKMKAKLSSTKTRMDELYKKFEQADQD